MEMGEYFFGITLNSTNKEHKWEPDELPENGANGGGDITFTPKGEHILVLKQALLVGGVDGEKNIVEVETAGYKCQVKIPIAALVGGKSNQVQMELTLPDPPATIRLIEGSGPVHIAGMHVIQTDQFNDDEDDDDEDEDDEDFLEDEIKQEEEEEEAEDIKIKGKGKKRTNSNTGQVPSKKRKSGQDA